MHEGAGFGRGRIIRYNGKAGTFEGGMAMTQNQWDDIQRTIDAMSEREKVELLNRVSHALGQAEDAAHQQKQALNRLRAELALLPNRNPADGFSNRDHDKIIYGGDGR